mgnify:FL=1
MNKSTKAALLVYATPCLAIFGLELLMFFYVKPMVLEKVPSAGNLWQFHVLGIAIIIGLWYPIRKWIYKDLMK